MANLTVLQIIDEALRLCSVLDPLESGATTTQYGNALITLNIMIDALAARGVVLQGLTTESFPLTAGINTYNIGPGATFNTTKPFKIMSGFFRDATNPLAMIDWPAEFMTLDQWDALSDKSFCQGPPQLLYFNPGVTQATTQTGVIDIYPAPNAGNTYHIYITSEKPFTEFAGTSETVMFPLAWSEMLVYNLAERLAPRYGKTLDQSVTRDAERSMNIVTRLCSRTFTMDTGLGKIPGGYDIASGDYL